MVPKFKCLAPKCQDKVLNSNIWHKLQNTWNFVPLKTSCFTSARKTSNLSNLTPRYAALGDRPDFRKRWKVIGGNEPNCFDKDLIRLQFRTAVVDKTEGLALGNYILYAELGETAAERQNFLDSYGSDFSPCALMWTESGVLCMFVPSMWMSIGIYIRTRIHIHICICVQVQKWTNIDLFTCAQAHWSLFVVKYFCMAYIWKSA